MNTLWRTHAANSGHTSEEDDLVLNAFARLCFGCKKKATKLMNATRRKETR
jgi:hypothetical protein